jgi:flagellar protein FliS
VAANLRSLYDYMLNRLTQANVLNDPSLVEEVSGLISKIKASWDRLVQEGL